VYLEIEERCNYRCLHCECWKNPGAPDKLTRGEAFSLLDALGAWLGRSWTLQLIRGEPLLSPELPEIVERGSAAGAAVSIITNGSLLTRDKARRLADAGLSTLTVSLDGLRPGTHDHSRGVPGAHAAAVKAVETVTGLERPAPVLTVAAIITGRNLDELPRLARWTADRPGCAGIIFNPLARCGSRWKELWPTEPAKAAAALDALIRLREEGLPILNPAAQLNFLKRYYEDPDALYPELVCESGESLWIGAEGACFLCDTGQEPIGSVRVQEVREIWDSPRARALRNEILLCKRSCLLNRCNYPREASRRDPIRPT